MRAFLVIILLSLPYTARADTLPTPTVVASIAPVHSLVAEVMQGAGSPRLLLPPGRSPHDYALRPSDAAALQDAAVVVWIGPELEAWLERPLASIAGGARVLKLDEVPELTHLKMRSGAAFEADDHDYARDYGEADVGELDPHIWLDPENAGAMLAAIAAVLAEADPAHATLYRHNASTATAGLDSLSAEIRAQLAPLSGRPFVVLHDAFHYFEHRFGIEAVGAVSLSDARMPGPAQIAAIRDLIRNSGAVCLFAEPELSRALVAPVAEGTGLRLGELDPLGATLEPGPGLYPALLRQLVANLADCLG